MNRVVIVLIVCGLLAPLRATFAQTPLPEIQIEDQTWKTSVGGLEFEDIDRSLSVIISPPEGADFSDLNQTFRYYLEACKAIIARAPEFYSEDHTPSSVDFVYLTVEKEGERLVPYELRERLDNGECVGRFGLQMPTLTQPFSKHDPNDEFLSVFHTWGLGIPEVSFETGTNGKTIAVEIERLKNFARNFETIEIGALCIHSLANIETISDVGVLKIRPENYPVIEIELVDHVSSLVGTVRRVVASVRLSLKDGQCSELLP